MDKRHLCGTGPAPAWPEKYYFNEIDITGYLHPGRNVLAVHLYYQGLVNRVWNSGDGRFALATRVKAETETAESVEGHTEGCIKEQIPLIWKYQIAEAYSGETTGYETQFLEDFDSRCWEQGWNQTDFDDSVWEPMVKARWADYKLIKQPTEMLAVYERAPKTVEKAEGCWFVDIGREITGSLRVKALGPWGAVVEVLCGEEKMRTAVSVMLRVRLLLPGEMDLGRKYL
ncbi:MAG: alpha-L-rhamnosidase N-terminal domain-containing protein [Blautia marasmi]